MPRGARAIDPGESLAAPGRAWTREKFKAALERRYSPRLHMSLILAASGLSAMLTSSMLLGVGVHSMLARYPVAIAISYGVFLVGVWTWLRVLGFVGNDGKRTGKGSSLVSDIDLPSGGGSGGGSVSLPRGSVSLPRGGGGAFDGGGASGSFAESKAQLVAANLSSGDSTGSTVSSTAGKAAGSVFDGLDGDGVVLLLLALALVAAIFVSSGYLIWCAPDVLTEAAFGAMLTGTLARPTRNETPDGWMGGVVKKTWWPFAIVMLVAVVFAGYAANHFPEASTFRQAIALATSR